MFRVPAGECLRFMVSEQGIEVDPEKIRVIQDMSPPKSVRDVQRLSGAWHTWADFLPIWEKRACLSVNF